jgi:hypothetical protein
VREGRSLRYLLPPAVAESIEKSQTYRAPAGGEPT